MKTVRVYYAGIPERNNNKEKQKVLENFHLGVSGAESTEIQTRDWQPSDLAVIQGWVHNESGNVKHLAFRKEVIDRQRESGGHTLAIDSNLFLYRDPGNANTYLRFSLDGVFPTTGNYFTKYVNPARWQQIKTDIGFDLKPWKNNGEYILVCCQRNGGWSMDGLHVMKWLNETITKIRHFTNKPILVRLHPKDKKAKTYIKNIVDPKIYISKKPSLVDDLEKAWATVIYNSSPGVASAIEGVPVFVTDPNPERSQAYDIANTDLTKLNNPDKPDRQAWIEKIAMSHFAFKDLRNGTAWKIIEQYL